MRSLTFLSQSGAIGLLAIMLSIPAAAQDCGCGGVPACQSCKHVICYHCRHHHRACGCGECKTREEAPARRSIETAPRAAIVESLPMFNASPGVFAMPMMMPMSVQPTAFQTREIAAPKAVESTCSTSSGRLGEIEERVNALDLRMRTIQRAVEIQTRILEDMKEEGSLPKRYGKSEQPAT